MTPRGRQPFSPAAARFVPQVREIFVAIPVALEVEYHPVSEASPPSFRRASAMRTTDLFRPRSGPTARPGRRRPWLTSVLLVLLTGTARAGLPPAEQAKVNEAIAKGVKYLQAQQQPN